MSDIENAPSLGQFLKEERERKGLSLDQVSSVTKIGVRVLQALEQDRYTDLPALPFVRGFVKTYCRLLQLDPNEILREYDAFLKEQSKSRPNREGGMSGYAFEKPEGEQAKRMLWLIMGVMLVFGSLVVFVFKPSLKHRKHGSVEKLQASPTPSIAATVSPSPGASVLALVTSSPSVSPGVSPAPDGSPSPEASLAVAAASPSPSPSPLVSPSVVAVAAASPTPSPSPSFSAPATPLVLISEQERVAQQGPAALVNPSPAPSPAASVAVAVPSPAPSPSPSPSVSVAAKPDPLQSGVDYAPEEVKYKVVLRALEDVWVRYRADDKKLMRFVLKKGRILVLRGKEVLRLQVSNPDAVSLTSNGRRYRTMSVIPQTVQHQGNSTLIWPINSRSRAAEIFPVNEPLPETPDPTPAATPGAVSGRDFPAESEGFGASADAEDLSN